jgi:hypothetical protein
MGISFVSGISTSLASKRYSVAFLVVFGTQFFNTAIGADFRGKWNLHTDIIATKSGDVKQGEFGENPERAIPSEAAYVSLWPRDAERVTTNSRAKAVMLTRAPCSNTKMLDDEIVCSAWEHAGALDKEPRTQTKRTTIQSRSGELADNVTENNPLLKELKKRGNVRTFSGGNVILEEIMYNDPSTNHTDSYSGYEVLNIAPNSPISAAQFPIAQYASAVTISGLEMLQNSSKEAIIDLLDGRIRVAEAQLMNRIDTDLYLDGTGNGGKNLIGLAAAVPDAPTSGTYGGIDRATWTFWQSKKFSGVTDGGGAVTAANIQSYMTRAALAVVRGSDKSDLIIADSNYYGLYVNSLQAIQRITSEQSGASGFAELAFYGGGTNAKVVLGSGIGAHATANHMWFLNTKYIHFRPHADRNFVPIGGERQAVNQDAIVKLMGWAGNLTTSGSQFQTVLIS